MKQEILTCYHHEKCPVKKKLLLNPMILNWGYFCPRDQLSITKDMVSYHNLHGEGQGRGCGNVNWHMEDGDVAKHPICAC